MPRTVILPAYLRLRRLLTRRRGVTQTRKEFHVKRKSDAQPPENDVVDAAFYLHYAPMSSVIWHGVENGAQ